MVKYKTFNNWVLRAFTLELFENNIRSVLMIYHNCCDLVHPDIWERFLSVLSDELFPLLLDYYPVCEFQLKSTLIFLLNRINLLKGGVYNESLENLC